MIKNIFIFWYQGFDVAPEIVKKCVHSWKFYNPDWNIILLDKNNFEQYVAVKKSSCLNYMADVVRVNLLKIYGGVWCDATTFCNKPLNDWLPNYIQQGFFAFNKPGPDRLLSNWFLYSENENYITNMWYEKILHYYNNHATRHTYFVFHYLFGDLYKDDSQFKRMWDAVPKLEANGMGPHYLQEQGLFNKICDKVKNDIDTKVTPMYKLTHKVNFSKNTPNSNLSYLYNTI